jgi:hypothetical protein
MDGKSNEERVYEALIALRHRGTGGSFVLVEEPQTKKFVQFGIGRVLTLDVPCVALTADEADRAATFFRQLGEDGPREYEAPSPRTGRAQHGAAYYHDFLGDARAAARAAVSFFETVYLLPPGTKLSVEEK